MINVNLFEIIDTIKLRPTHNNIMYPGFGVGGYCLTKDPLFGKASSNQIFGEKFDFPLSSKAVEVNQKMTSDVMSEIKNKFKKKILGKKVLLIGVSYREDTNDTRHSPAEGVHDFFRKMGCRLKFYDPGVNYWEYTDNHSIEKKYLDDFDIYVHLIKHQIFEMAPH